MMAGRRSNGKDDLETAAAAFLAEVEIPPAPQRLREYGLQRVLVRARAKEGGKAPATARRAYRNPALLRHTLVVVMAVLLVMTLSTTGAYAFSLDAQPDSPLYGTKIFFERARVILNLSSAGDMRLEMDFSERRMEELRRMAASGKAGGAERWLREYGRNIEVAGSLAGAVSGEDAERLSLQFQEMLERQALMMQEIRRGQPSGLEEPIEGAFRICDQERARMRQRCGQQGAGAPAQEGGQGDGDCPRTEDSSPQEGASSATFIEPSGSGSAPGESSPLCGEGTLSGDALEAGDEPVEAAPDASQPRIDAPESEQASRDMEYRGDGPGKGHMP